MHQTSFLFKKALVSWESFERDWVFCFFGNWSNFKIINQLKMLSCVPICDNLSCPDTVVGGEWSWSSGQTWLPHPWTRDRKGRRPSSQVQCQLLIAPLANLRLQSFGYKFLLLSEGKRLSPTLSPKAPWQMVESLNNGRKVPPPGDATFLWSKTWSICCGGLVYSSIHPSPRLLMPKRLFLRLRLHFPAISRADSQPLKAPSLGDQALSVGSKRNCHTKCNLFHVSCSSAFLLTLFIWQFFLSG